MTRSHRSSTIAAGYLAAILALTLSLAGCGDDQPNAPEAAFAPVQPVSAQSAAAGTLSKDNPGVRRAMEVQNRNLERFLEKKGVVGVGTGLTENGEPAIVVFTEKSLGMGRLPERIEGVPVIERVSGRIMLTGKGGNSNNKKTSPSNTTSPSTTARLPRPVPIGTSTSNWYDCSAGTIGVRVKNGENYYVLSCNHVFARLNAASIGEHILQPGRSDVSCGQNLNDRIGQLAAVEYVTYGSSSSNIMDAALVSTTPALISNSTPQDGYGIPSSTPKSPALGMEVQKYGRSTGLTTGEICAINMALTVPYPSGPALFTNQIVVQPKRKNKSFAESGDSGALVVTDDANANPLGILYAKSGNYIYVSPIDPILTRFNVQIDGK